MNNFKSFSVLFFSSFFSLFLIYIIFANINPNVYADELNFGDYGSAQFEDLNSADFSTMIYQETESVVKKNAKLIIRNGSEIIFNGEIELTDQNINILASDATYSIPQNTVLGILASLDLLSSNFEISDIDYYASFDSFLINCVKISNEENSDPLCYNWQFVVNNQYPFVGVDDVIINDQDEIYFYFGNQKQITLPNSILEDQEFEIMASKYDYVNNVWLPIVDEPVGIFTIPNPAEWWNVNEIEVKNSDIEGKIVFSGLTVGDYQTGFKNDFYYPSYSFAVITSDQVGGDGETEIIFNKNSAINFLFTFQEENGGFDEDLLTDWVAVGLGANKEENELLEEYLKRDSIGNDLTDYLRRAMALMSVGLNPQTEYKYNLVEKIIEEFDGEQFGDDELVNDDIFAVLVLSNLGFDYDDEVIKKSINFILENQSSNGSWEGIDLTAASIQALNNYSDVEKISLAISRAKNYLSNNKSANGSWNNNVYSTAWSILAINNLGEDIDTFGNDKNPFEYLGIKQDADGGLIKADSEQNRIWSTAYAVAAASYKDWNSILKNFKKIEIESESEESSAQDSDAVEEQAVIEEDLLQTKEQEEDLSSENLSFVNFEESVVDSKKDNEQNQDFGGEEESDTNNIEKNPDFERQSANALGGMPNTGTIYLALGILFALIGVAIFKLK